MKTLFMWSHCFIALLSFIINCSDCLDSFLNARIDNNMILTKLIRNITGNSKRFIVLSNCLDSGNIVMFFFKWNHKNMILMKLTTTTGNITWKDVWPNLLGLAIQSSWWQYCYGCPEMDHPANNRWNNSIEKRTLNK